MFAGIWGSAFTVLLQRVLRERKLPSDTVDEMSNMGDLRDELSTSFRALSILPKLPVISVGSQMEKSVSVWSDRNTRDPPPSGGGPATLTGRSEICRSILQSIVARNYSANQYNFTREITKWPLQESIGL